MSWGRGSASAKGAHQYNTYNDFFVFTHRWGMADEKLQTEFITDMASLNQLLVDATKELHDFYIVTENVLMVTWMYKEEYRVGGHKSNIFIAAFTTSWARLKLYEEIEKLGDRLYYKDTDSI